MSLGFLVLGAVLFASTALILWNAPRVWRNERGMDADSPPANWMWGRPAWRGFVRGVSLVLPLEMTLLSLTLLTVAISGGDDAGLSMLSSVLACFTTFVIIAGHGCAGLLNRPKWLVAPHLRHQPGMIAEIFGAPVENTPPPGGQSAY